MRYLEALPGGNVVRKRTIWWRGINKLHEQDAGHDAGIVALAPAECADFFPREPH